MTPKQASATPIAPRRQFQSNHLPLSQHLYQYSLVLIVLHHLRDFAQPLMFVQST